MAPHRRTVIRGTIGMQRLRASLARLAFASALVIVTVGCSPARTTSPSLNSQPSAAPSTTAAATVAPSSTLAAAIPSCVRNGAAALAGVVEVRPAGWSDQTPSAPLTDVPNTVGRVYGPEPVTAAPYEGPGRLVLYETMPANDGYLQNRVTQARQAGGTSTAVDVCGEATKVWTVSSSGELLIGWTDRNKSDVLVANTADFTVDALVRSAESVSDCCG